MNHQQQIAAWAVAVCLPVLLNLLTKRDSDAIGLSAMLLLTWCFGRIMGSVMTPPESMSLYPLVDSISGIVALAAWRSRRAWWKLALVGLLTAQCCLHVAFWAAWPHDGSLYRYILANNVLCALELFACSTPGVGHLVATWDGYSLPLRPRTLRRARLK